MEELGDIKLIIKSILVASPFQLRVIDLAKQFRESEGYNIPFQKFGYYNLEQFLKSMRDILQITGSGNSAEIRVLLSEKSAHVSELIANQKMTSRKPPRNRYRSQANCRRPKHRMYNPREVHYFKQSIEINKQYNASCSSEFESAEEDFQKEQDGYQENEDFNNQENTELRTSTPINDQLDNDVADNNTNSQSSNCSGDSYNNTGAVPKHGNSAINYKIPYIVQNNLRELVKEYPQGVSCSKIRNLYKQKFNKDLKYNDYGYKSLIEMINTLQYLLHHKQINQGDFIIYDIDVPIPPEPKQIEETKSSDSESENTTPLPKIIDASIILSFPANVVTLNDKIPIQKLERVDDFIEIRIAEIYDPSKFWFNIVDENESLNTLMDELQEFYSIKQHKYNIPMHMIMQGLYCATVFENEFHRAIIVHLLPNDENSVKAFFIDFGTVTAVPIKSICFLHKRFMDLPAQGLRGRLGRILPVYENSEWPRAASTRFLSLIKNKTLVACIDNIDEKNECFELIVADTSSNEDIYINDALVKENHAIFSHQEQKENPNVNNPRPIVKHIHLYPTFEEIEHAKVPTAFEFYFLDQSTIPRHLLFSQYYSLEKPNESSSQTFNKVNEQIEIEDKISVINNITKKLEIKKETPHTVFFKRSSNCKTDKRISTNCDLNIKTNESKDVVTKDISETKPIGPPPGFENVIPNKQPILPQNNIFNLNHNLQHPHMVTQQKMMESNWINQRVGCQNINPYALHTFPSHFQYPSNTNYYQQNMYNYPITLCQQPSFSQQNDFIPCLNITNQSPMSQNQPLDPYMLYNPEISFKNFQVSDSHIPIPLNFSSETLETKPIKYYAVVRIDEYNLNCILHKDEPYVILKNVQENYLDNASVVHIKRTLAAHFIEIDNINLKYHEVLAVELIRYGLIDDQLKILEVVALKWLPELIRIITNKSWEFPGFDNLLQNFAADSSVWINNE